MAPLPKALPIKAWPFEEAAKVVARMDAAGQTDALFETGYGPSGLPHIGTFGEVARTTWVRQAYTALTGRPARLLAFSDDIDALRKVPDNVPNGDMLRAHLGQPLTRIPDPFGTHDSFGAHNNAELRRFLDGFGFHYEFASATDYYTSGRFDAALRQVLRQHDEIRAVILPSLGPDRRATYSPILPIHPHTGAVMQVVIEAIDVDAATVTWADPAGESFTTSVLGGAAKLQWKADWAMRWHALGVDYEMSGKDLIDSVKLSGRICQVLGSTPPVGFTYELFLDEHAQKISKSRGNGLSVDEWLRYAPPESLAQFMYHQPQRAKRLFFDVIPRAVDDYIANVAKARHEGSGQEGAGQEGAGQEAAGDDLSNPAWHINGGHIPQDGSPITFTMLLNLASVADAGSADILWSYVKRYYPGTTPSNAPFLSSLVERAVTYYRDFVLPTKRFREPTSTERVALADLAASLEQMPQDATAELLQNEVYAVGNRHFPRLKDWFDCLYQVLLGKEEGPRLGAFIAIYGIQEMISLIRASLHQTVEIV